MANGEQFPAAAFDAWKTHTPKEQEDCVRCRCVPGVQAACDRPEICACHWTQRDMDAMNADAERRQA